MVCLLFSLMSSLSEALLYQLQLRPGGPRLAGLHCGDESEDLLSPLTDDSYSPGNAQKTRTPPAAAVTSVRSTAATLERSATAVAKSATLPARVPRHPAVREATAAAALAASVAASSGRGTCKESCMR
ncbi:hypothetical protein BD413DRAFT_497457 [Trametes elegans]|nr:hypothetical protein BD413DRAFT_497457 [Trametes elegans]